MRDWIVTFKDGSTVTVEALSRLGALTLAEIFEAKIAKDARQA